MGWDRRARLAAVSLDWPVHHLGEIDSTNNEAKRRAATGAFLDSWLVAEVQTGGRGRAGRAWASTAGNLFATALFHEAGGMRIAARLPFACALAVSDVASRVAPDKCEEVRLKWPNDVRIAGSKLSGILIETGGANAELWVAAGIGINVSHIPDSAGQSATCLADLAQDGTLTAELVLQMLREAFWTRLMQARNGFADVRADWLDRAEGLGQTVRVSPGGAPVEGIFEDLTEDGGLILRLPDGTRQTIRAGDVDLIGRG